MNKKTNKSLLKKTTLILALLITSPQQIEAIEKKKLKKIAAWIAGTSVVAGLSYLIYRLCRKPCPQWKPKDVQQKPLYRELLEEYRSLSPKKLAELRSEWKNNSSESKFTSDELIGEYVKIAHELYCYTKEESSHEKDLQICCLGQSLSYIVLITQFFKALNNEPADNCIYIALSNDKENINQIQGTRRVSYTPPSDDYLKIYYEYLKAQHIISHNEKTILMCDQVESGKTIIEWETIVQEMKRFLQPGEKLPKFRYYIHYVPLEELPENIPPFDVSFSLYETPNKPTSPFEIAWTSLIKAKEELRLIPSYAPKDWDTNNPFKKPQKEARLLALRFLDYILNHGVSNF